MDGHYLVVVRPDSLFRVVHASSGKAVEGRLRDSPGSRDGFCFERDAWQLADACERMAPIDDAGRAAVVLAPLRKPLNDYAAGLSVQGVFEDIERIASTS